jgi:hypothetical protein
MVLESGQVGVREAHDDHVAVRMTACPFADLDNQVDQAGPPTAPSATSSPRSTARIANRNEDPKPHAWHKTA